MFLKKLIPIVEVLLNNLIEKNGIYALVKSFFNDQPNYCFIFVLRHDMLSRQMYAETNALILWSSSSRERLRDHAEQV